MRYDGWIYKTPKVKCKGCEQRYLGCHDHCEDYQKARAEFLQEKQTANSNRTGGLQVDRHNADQFKKVIRRKK
jgi:hypothetical protein